MKRLFITHVLVLLAASATLAQVEQPVANYLYFTEYETTEQDGIVWFYSPDHLRGPVRSNDRIAIKGSPTFTDSVLTTAESFLLGYAADPMFTGPDPIFNAPILVDLLYQNRLDSTQLAAQDGGWFYPDFDAQRQTHITAAVDGWHVVQWAAGTPYPDDPDNLLLEDWIEYGDRFIFVEGRLDLSGVRVQGNTYLAASGTIRLIDDIQYADLRVDNRQAGLMYPTTTYTGEHKLVLISGEDILVANTVANGQGNGSASGSMLDPSNKHIVISARLETPSGSFSFENQNNSPDDPNGWDGYWWCDPDGANYPTQDERGSIMLYGALAQQRRGYVHRSNCNGTGYEKLYLYDERFHSEVPPGYEPITVDVSEGDVEWRDTTIVVTEQVRQIVLEGNGTLIVGPGTEIRVEVREYNHGSLFIGERIQIAGEEGNPVRFHFDQESDELYQPFQLGQIQNPMLQHMNITGTRLQLDLSQVLSFCDINAQEMNLATSSGFLYIDDCHLAGAVNVEGMLSRFRRNVVEGCLTTRRMLRGENCVFSFNPDFPEEDVALTLLNQDVGRLDRLINVYFEGDYSTLATTEARLLIRYCGWSSDQSHSSLFDGDVEYEGTNLDAVAAHFWDEENSDYHLRNSSPLIDAGDPDSDLDPDGSRADIGAYPFDPTYTEAPEVDPESGLPMAFGIENLYPNPFNGMTTLSLTLPRTGEVEVTVVDLLGRQVEVLHRGVMRAGQATLSLNLEQNPSGLYFVVVRMGSHHATMKAMLVK